MAFPTQFTQREVIMITIIGLFLISAVAGISYYLGYQRNIEIVKLMEREQHIKDGQYGKSLDRLQKENEEIATRSGTICAEYQKLYQAYDKLYTAAPNTDERYVIPGSARGQVDPCYGENE